MLFHSAGGVGDALAGGIGAATSEGGTDVAPARPVVDAGDALDPAPTQPATKTVTRASSAAPASRVRMRLEFVFMPHPAFATWLRLCMRRGQSFPRALSRDHSPTNLPPDHSAARWHLIRPSQWINASDAVSTRALSRSIHGCGGRPPCHYHKFTFRTNMHPQDLTRDAPAFMTLRRPDSGSRPAVALVECRSGARSDHAWRSDRV
jgi:hypothetical protein